MGLNMTGISSSTASVANAIFPTPPNPNPLFYTIKDHLEVGSFLILVVKYHGVTTFEGLKILVYADETFESIKSQKALDPHFSESASHKHPVARFEPTERGFRMAVKLCEMQ